MTVGYLLVGHGTRRTAGQSQFATVYRQFADMMSPAATEMAFLELAEPDIPTAVARLADAGVDRLVTVPVLLFSAGHAESDIPDAVQVAASQHGVELLRQTSSLECCEPILELSAQRFREAVCRDGRFDACRNCCLGNYCNSAGLVMVGRGSGSDSATAEMRRFTELRVAKTPVLWHRTAFIHAQHPTTDAALDALAAADCSIAVVQPHLLFEGQLMDDLRANVAVRQAQQPSKRWILTETLGVDECLARALSATALADST